MSIGKMSQVAVIGLFLILAFSAVAAAREFLMPVTMAVLLFFVFVPFRRSLYQRGIPHAVSAALVVLGLTVTLVFIGLMLMGPAAELIDSAPTFAATIEQKLGDLTGPMQKLQLLAAKIDAITGGAVNASAPAPAEGPNFVRTVLAMGPQLVTQILFVLLLLYFMMASGDLLYLKIVQSFPTLGSKRQAYSALRTIEDSLGSYLSTITVINVGLGIAIGVTMWAYGMPAAALIGVGGFLLNYIPYLGAIAGAGSAFVIALVSLDGFLTPMLVGVSYLALTSIEGQFITPQMVSRKLEMNTVVVFLAVALWAWLWSVVGMIVAVPLLVVMRVLCDHVPGLERLGNFLGGEDPPPLGPEGKDNSDDDAEGEAVTRAGEAT
jgi:predicted PurR-regulated permease PerM